MEVTDQSRARSALTLLGIIAFCEVGLLLVSFAVPSLIGAFGGIETFQRWFTAQQFLWLAATGATVFALIQLEGALEDSELLFIVLGCAAVLACLECFWIVQELTRAEGDHHGASKWVSLASMAIGLGLTLGLCILIGKLGRTTAFAAGIGVFVVIRSLIGIGTLFAEERLPMWVYTSRSVLSVLISAALGALAFHARGAVTPETPGGATGMPAPIVEASGMRLIVTGVALLVLGIGGSVASFQVASSGSGGGRYVVAAGAIAIGLVQLVRGLTRLGR